MQVTWEDVGSTVSIPVSIAEYKRLTGQPGTVAKVADMNITQSTATRAQADYEFPYPAHTPMEPLNCTTNL